MVQVADLVTLDDVAAHLNWNAQQQAAQAAEMGHYISAATPLIEDIVGPVVQRAFDEWHDGGSSRIILDNTPVVSVASVSESYGANMVFTLDQETLDSGSFLSAYAYTFDAATGLLVRRASGMAGRFASGVRNVRIQYTAGLCPDTASVPANIRLATLELVRINWQPQQGGNRPGYGGTTGGMDAVNVSDPLKLGFFVPGRVMELLKPNANKFGLA